MAKPTGGDDEFDEGPPLWSPYDEPDEAEEPPWFLPGPGAAPVRSRPQPASGIGAEALALGDAAAAVARLDERLAAMSAPRRAGHLRRLALEGAADVLWAEGVRVRPERLVLADLDRTGQTEEAGPALVRAAWAVRRLLGGPGLDTAPAGLARFLGWRAGAGADPLAPLAEALVECAATHPLIRAGRTARHWQALAPGEGVRLLEPAVAAACTGAEGMTAAALPLGPALTGGMGMAATDETGWLTALAQTARSAHRRVLDIAAWEARTARATAALQGKGAPALIALLAARPAVSARIAAGTLGITATQARSLLNRFEDLGATRELTGHTRFRFWQVRL